MMGKYVVATGPVDHDGTIYEEGSELSLTEDAAAALVAVGVIQQVEQHAKSRKAPADDVR